LGRDRISGGGIKPEADLHFLIQQLDGIRAFRRVGLARMEQSFERLGMFKAWGRIKGDVERIAYFPETVPGLPRLIRIATALRSLFPLALLSLLLALFLRLGVFPMPAASVYWIFVLAPLLIMFVFVGIDLTVRRRIAAEEGANPDLHEAEKRRIKELIDELANRLSIEVRLKGEDAARYRMRLYFSDYRGVEVVGKRVERVFGVFRRSYSRFLCVPAAKKRKKS